MFLVDRTFSRLFRCWKLGLFLTFMILFAGTVDVQADVRPLAYSAVAIRDHEATIAAHAGIVTTVSAAINRDVRILVHDNNHTLVDNFINNRIDVAYLGPLPYLIISRQYPDLAVLAAVNEESGKPLYRCVLVSAHDGPDSADDVGGPVALTSPMSTCGYLSMAFILSHYGLDIEALDYTFLGSHEQVALGVILGHYPVGGVMDIIAKRYQGLLLKVLDSTSLLPGFVLVANRNSFSEVEIDRMRAALLDAEAVDYQSWGVGNYGFSSADQLDYGDIDTMMTPEFGNLFMDIHHDR